MYIKLLHYLHGIFMKTNTDDAKVLYDGLILHGSLVGAGLSSVFEIESTQHPRQHKQQHIIGKRMIGRMDSQK